VLALPIRERKFTCDIYAGAAEPARPPSSCRRGFYLATGEGEEGAGRDAGRPVAINTHPI